jgi:hypothetical protein
MCHRDENGSRSETGLGNNKDTFIHLSHCCLKNACQLSSRSPDNAIQPSHRYPTTPINSALSSIIALNIAIISDESKVINTAAQYSIK